MPAGRNEAPGQDAVLVDAKRALRSQLVEQRKRRSPAERSTAGAANARSVLELCRPGALVCGFDPLPSEPLNGEVWQRAAAAGCRVLLPAVAGAAPLDWVELTPGIRRGRGAWGIAEPVGPRLGPDAVVTASVVVLPALAVDPAGYRLGRGGGHYDRTAVLLASNGGEALLVAVCFDDELLPAVPHDRWDARVDAVVTPAGGLRRR